MLLPQWRLAIIVIAVIAAAVTPTVDPVNMSIVMAPLIVLYFISILLSYLAIALRGKEASPYRRNMRTSMPAGLRRLFLIGMAILTSILYNEPFSAEHYASRRGLHPSGQPVPTPVPLPLAETGFSVSLPAPLPGGSTLSVAVLDEVTGLPLNPVIYPLSQVDSQHYTGKLPFPSAQRSSTDTSTPTDKPFKKIPPLTNSCDTACWLSQARARSATSYRAGKASHSMATAAGPRAKS